MVSRSMRTLVVTGCAVICALLVAGGGTPSEASDSDLERLYVLETELGELEAEIQRLEDAKAIKRLQRAYGYYLEQKLGSELRELFSDDATVELGGLGVYVGKNRIGEFYDWFMGGSLQEGQLFTHLLMQGVVHVDPDGNHARGRWRALIMRGQHGQTAEWAEGPYENEYVKQGGVWKLSKVHWYQTLAAPYAQGWHQGPMALAGPSEDFPPDMPPSEVYDSYPGSYLPPYHYDNPVSGRPAEEP